MTPHPSRRSVLAVTAATGALTAMPDAWAASGSLAGADARGGFVVDLRWRDGKPTEARIRSVGGRTTTVAHAGSARTVTLKPGATVTLKGFDR